MSPAMSKRKMDLHKAFDESGFLSEDISSWMVDLRAENDRWFALADDINTALMRTANASMAAVKTNVWAPEAVAVRVLLRSCGTFQGVILLTERGMVVEGRMLARSLIENAFCIAALIDNPAALVEMLRSDSEASRSRQAKFILAEKLFAGGATRTKLQTVIDAIGKAQTMNIREVSKLGPLTSHYLAYQRLSDCAAHLSAKSLHQHVSANEEKTGWTYKWGPASKGDSAATLHQAILAALSIGIGITQMLNDTAQNSKFGELSNRLDEMEAVPVI
jgi:hypothetical protein